MQHPDYPIEFKPAIAAYDWDQTYDILGFSYLPKGFESLMTLCNIPAYETLAVDRFTPYDYLWAINYSDYLYGFLGYFNYCPNNSVVRRIAMDIDGYILKLSGNSIWIDGFNYFNNLLSYDSLNYFITIPKGKIKITWLTNDGYQKGLISYIYTLNQCLINFNFEQETQIDLFNLQEDFKNNFCANSLVFSQLINDQWVEFTPQGINNNFLLYRDIQSYFEGAQQALIAYFDFVHNNYGSIAINQSSTGKKVILSAMPFKCYLQAIRYNHQFSVALDENGIETSNYIKEPAQSIYENFPYFLDQLCFLQRANNNKWRLGQQLSDIGFYPRPNLFLTRDQSFSFNNFLTFNAHDAHVSQNQINFVRQFRTLDYDHGNIPPLFPKEIIQTDGDYQINLINPKSSYYLWDYPIYEPINEWVNYNIFLNFPSVVSITQNDYDNNFSFFAQSAYFLSGLRTEVLGGSNGISNLPLIRSFFKKNSYFSYLKKIIDSSYEIVLGRLQKQIHNSPAEYIKYEILFKLLIKIPYSIFDIVNLPFPSGYLSFENLGMYGETGYYDSRGVARRNSYIGNPIYFNEDYDSSTEFQLWTQSEYENLYNYGIISDSDYLIYLQNLKIQVQNNMVDSVRVKEIHSCLGASEFSYINNNPTTPIYMHMARKLDYIAKVLGIAFNGDGSIMGIRQSKALENGETIPAGWNFGQFGRNDGNNSSNNAQQGGNASEERLGIIYDVRSNKFIKNPASGEEDIKQGGYVLCESIPQMLHIMLDDLDRALGLQTLGAIAITNQNYNDDYNGGDLSITTPYYKYNGLGDAFVEVMHTLADTHKQAFQANIGSLKSQAITVEILGALGVGCIEKKIILEVDDQPVKIVYPGFNGITPSIADLQMWTLTNQSFLNEVMA
jgi:hypothetical protein